MTLVIVVWGAISSACGPGRITMPGAITPGETTETTTVRVRVSGRVVTVPLERYVAGAALSEVTPTGETPAVAARIYEVQTVIARTYGLAHRGRHAAEGFDLCDDTHCQLYQPDRLTTSSFARAAVSAAERTRGRVLRDGARIIDAVFHADCGGHTTTPATAWSGTNHPYLPARQDDVPGLTHRQWMFEATLADWRAILDSDTRTSVGPALRRIEVVSTGPGDRVTAVRLVGSRERVVSGEGLRAVVTAARGPRSLMSTRFMAQTTPTGIRLAGTGFGHGVGLCQVGAIARARRGDSLTDILDHYYPGARLGG